MFIRIPKLGVGFKHNCSELLSQVKVACPEFHQPLCSDSSYILNANGFGVTSGSIINGWFVQALPIDRIIVLSGFQEKSVL